MESRAIVIDMDHGPEVRVTGFEGQTATMIATDQGDPHKAVILNMGRAQMEAIVRELQECFTFWDTPSKPWGESQ
ncbi:hypothetical protein [Streptomyces sp. PsTaAH-124]|uniref:hypothetical protein n=1 Tax=Streptomyces sp. PsTaAH-124 TaxID=1157638 RepID=UPI000374D0D5|nr:hypothetical protein [Streptomyces sp. PsTaAH-124]